MTSRGSIVSSLEHQQICEDSEIDNLESRNGLLQFDEVRRLASSAFESDHFELDIATILNLHEHATRDIYNDAGHLRNGPVHISGTNHEPPPHGEVPDLVDEMVNYVNENWGAKPLHLCSYLMWRCNWIHPFFDGNGRTTRALSYLVFIASLGYEPGGTPTWVDMIADDKRPYYSALDDADDGWKAGKLDVSSMEALVERLLARQLMSIVADAGRDSH
jgi:Fic family protein